MSHKVFRVKPHALTRRSVGGKPRQPVFASHDLLVGMLSGYHHSAFLLDKIIHHGVTLQTTIDAHGVREETLQPVIVARYAAHECSRAVFKYQVQYPALGMGEEVTFDCFTESYTDARRFYVLARCSDTRTRAFALKDVQERTRPFPAGVPGHELAGIIIYDLQRLCIDRLLETVKLSDLWHAYTRYLYECRVTRRHTLASLPAGRASVRFDATNIYATSDAAWVAYSSAPGMVCDVAASHHS